MVGVVEYPRSRASTNEWDGETSKHMQDPEFQICGRSRTRPRNRTQLACGMPGSSLQADKAYAIDTPYCDH